MWRGAAGASGADARAYEPTRGEARGNVGQRGCADQSTGGRQSTSADRSAAAAQPKKGGVLKQAFQGDPVSLDPMLKVQNDVMWLGVFERLTAYDDAAQAAADAGRELGDQQRCAVGQVQPAPAVCSSTPAVR